MKILRMVALSAAVVAAAGLGAGATLLAGGPSGSSTRSVANPSTAARTTFPGLSPATGEPDLDGLASARPSSGQVVQVPGPFDDRFVLRRLHFDGRSVSGELDVTSDVSDLLELEVLAGFYDDRGRLLGTGRFVHHLVEGRHGSSGPPEESVPFTVRVPHALLPAAVSAAVGVPVLVNE